MPSTNYYQFTAEQTLKSLDSRKEGLTPQEVEQRLRFYGKNRLIAVNKEPLIFKFLHQFKDLMAVILIIAGGFSLFMKSYRDAFIMFAIVLINALISFFQEYKAERVMNSLKSLVQAKAKVIRNGKEIEIDAQMLVPGDIVVLEEGDAVPGDIRIIEENTLSSNDFSLTGESSPTRKFIHPIEGACELGNRNNLSFMGTTVATGNGLGVVIATGMQTELGKIANLSQQTEVEQSPLQKELNNMAKKVSYIVLLVSATLFIVGILIDLSLKESFLFALGIAASCVPEGLPTQVSVALSLASGRLAQKKAVVKKLSAVETLGATHIICTDKTGTLTTNEMTVQKLLIGEKTYDVSGLGYEPKGQILDSENKPLTKTDLEKIMIFFENGVLASNAKIRPPDKEHPNWFCIGDPTEAALISLAEKAGIDSAKLDKNNRELKEFTFDAARKRMSSVRDRKGRTVIYAKGAPQSLLERCSQFWDGTNIRPLTENDRKLILQKVDEFSSLALRNLGFAYRELSKYDPDIKMDEAENDLIWLGVSAMIDPPRKEVKDAIAQALKAYIRVIIITGDYALTAEAIAKRIGMSKGKDKTITVVTGKELQTLSDIDLLQKLIYTNLIFARTSPEDKLRIVNLLKKAGEVVAVTGDGVNDAPALKKADIGVAMGKTGTEVAKDSAELVLLDDSFGTLVSAIREGRIIFQNLRKNIVLNLNANGAELFTVLLSLTGTVFFGYPLAIAAVQILAIDLLGEILPLTFLTWDPANPKLMSSPPRNTNEHVVNYKLMINLIWTSLLMGIFAYINFIAVFYRSGVSPLNIAETDLLYMRATTLTYMTIVVIQWVNIMSRRAGPYENMFTSYFWTNKKLFLAFAISLFFILNVSYNPYISQFLRTAPLKLSDWGFAVLAAICYLIIRETYKWQHRMRVATVKSRT